MTGAGARAEGLDYYREHARGRSSAERTLAGELLKRALASPRFRRGVDATGRSYSRTVKLDASGGCAAERLTLKGAESGRGGLKSHGCGSARLQPSA
jgi:hypothetical protein